MYIINIPSLRDQRSTSQMPVLYPRRETDDGRLAPLDALSIEIVGIATKSTRLQLTYDLVSRRERQNERFLHSRGGRKGE